MEHRMSACCRLLFSLTLLLLATGFIAVAQGALPIPADTAQQQTEGGARFKSPPIMFVENMRQSDQSPLVQQGWDLSWWTVDGGGHTFSTGGNFRLGATIGQPDAGVLSAGDFILTGGVWSGGMAAPVRYSTYLPVVLRHH